MNYQFYKNPLKTINYKLKTNYGFTFIELIISISILALFSIVGVSQFQNFFSKKSFENEISNTQNYLNSLDNEISSQKNTSYKITFFSGSSYILIEKGYIKNPEITLSKKDLFAGTGTFITDNLTDGNWTINISENDEKSFSENKYSSGETYDFNLSKNSIITTYKFQINGLNTNSFEFYNFTIPDIAETTDSKIQFFTQIISINSGNNTCESGSIENIFNKKTISCNGAKVDKLQIQLEKGSQDYIMELN